jgi:hypothetical protein
LKPELFQFLEYLHTYEILEMGLRSKYKIH